MGELAAIDAQVKAADAELETVRSELASVASKQSQAESELSSCEDRIKSVERRLYGGEVSASRELQALSADAEALRRRASDLEDRVLELLDQREPLDDRVDRLVADLDSAGRRRAGVQAAVASAEAELDAEKALVTGPRAQAAARVPPALLASYERLRSRLGGIGVARVVGNHCDGCHLTLSSVELDRIRHLPDDDVATCEQCSRILVPAGS
jgi:predicted  nucleic acid-binding Zn-ribbon protein